MYVVYELPTLYKLYVWGVQWLCDGLRLRLCYWCNDIVVVSSTQTRVGGRWPNTHTHTARNGASTPASHFLFTLCTKIEYEMIRRGRGTLYYSRMFALLYTTHTRFVCVCVCAYKMYAAQAFDGSTARFAVICILWSTKHMRAGCYAALRWELTW